MQILKMDFQSQSAPPVVPVMQSDAQSRFIGIALYNGGTPYKAPDGAVYTVQYRGEGANNFGWYDQILTASGNRAAVTVDADSSHIVTLELAEQALRRPGDVHVNLCVMGPDTGYELRTFDIIARVGGAAYPDDVAVQSYFFVTGVTSASWLTYVSTCLEAQQAAEKAVKLAGDSATTAQQAAASAAADAKNAQDNASSAKEAADQITSIANGCKGYYSTAQDLRDAYPTADAGSWAIVAENSTIWVWNPATSAWKDSSVNVDFSEYYKKSEADAKFGTPFTLTPATADQLGGVKVGGGLSVTADGALSAEAYPVGSIYQSTDPTSPAALFGGSWEEIASERVLMGASSTHAAGTTAKAGLPNITGTANGGVLSVSEPSSNGAFGATRRKTIVDYHEGDDMKLEIYDRTFDASKSNAIYGRSSTVQPAAYYVHIWHRVS